MKIAQKAVRGNLLRILDGQGPQGCAANTRRRTAAACAYACDIIFNAVVHNQREREHACMSLSIRDLG